MSAKHIPSLSLAPDIDAGVGEMLAGQVAAAQAAATLAPQIADAVSAAVPRLQRGGRIILVGAGTSGRIAVQDGVELAPTYGWPMDRLTFLLAGGRKALVESSEAAERSEEHTSELQSLMRISYAVFCLKNKTKQNINS